MSLVPASDIQLRPFRIPVEGQTVGTLVLVVNVLEVFKLDISGPVTIEETEGDVVLGVRLLEEILKVAPVLQSDTADAFPIGDQEKERVLLSFDLVLLR
jgi:hypothetical protein